MGLNGWEWIVLLIVVLLLFGTRIPQVMRSMGQGVHEFKKGAAGEGEAPAGQAQASEGKSRPNSN